MRASKPKTPAPQAEKPESVRLAEKVLREARRKAIQKDLRFGLRPVLAAASSVGK